MTIWPGAVVEVVVWSIGKTVSRKQSVRAETAEEFARVRLGFEPDELQAQVIGCEHPRVVLNCTRQWGKSTVTAVKAIHRAYTEPEALVLVASPSQRQSGEFVRKASVLMRRAGMRVRGDGYNDMSLQFDNGSRIVGLPGLEGTVRGFSSVSLLLIDEASRVEDAMYQALRPMLARGKGDLWLMSTPNAKRGFFYEVWEHGGPEWVRVKAPATACARISQKFLDEEMAEYGEDVFRREYMCEFLDSGAEVFDRDLLARAMDDGVKQVEI